MDINLKDGQKFSELLNTAGKKELADIIRYFYEICTAEELETLYRQASNMRDKYYGRRVYLRGLLEFSNYCRNNCFYCGLRRDNANARRYRLTEEEIIGSCSKGYDLGFRTFVLQSGEDLYYTDIKLCLLISKIKERFPDCAVTLSIGERSYESYKQLYNAGADRYLLRHETANEAHYGELHPPELRLKNRIRSLYNLKEIGYQVGAGFMVDSPCQTYDTLSEDLIFLRELKPHMVGIGPFIPHKDTKFAACYKTSSAHTFIMLALIKIMLPKVLLPATTALGTVDKTGREKGFIAGANVLMPNISPPKHRADYSLYDNKLCTGLEATEQLKKLTRYIETIGFIPDFSRGDYVDFQKTTDITSINK